MLTTALLSIAVLAAPGPSSQDVAATAQGPELTVRIPEEVRPGHPWVLAFAREQDPLLSALGSRGFVTLTLDLPDGTLPHGAPAQRAEVLEVLSAAIARDGLAGGGGLIGRGAEGLLCLGLVADAPLRFHALYLEDPVVDPMSWPAGLGRGEGDPEAWAQLLAAWELDPDAIQNHLGLPLERTNEIVRGFLPMLISVDGPERVAPARENGARFARRVQQNWGQVRTIDRVVTDEAATRAQALAFLERHAEGANPHATVRAGLPGLRHAIQAGEEPRIAFVGGDNTRREGWAGFAARSLRAAFPDTTFQWVEGGAPRCHAVGSALRLERDVLAGEPLDLLVVEVGVPERRVALDRDELRRGLEGIVRRARAASPGVDVLLVHLPDAQALAVRRAGREPLEAQVVEEVAEAYQLPSIRLDAEIFERIASGELDWERQFGGPYPKASGHRHYARSLERVLVSQLRLPAERDADGALVAPTPASRPEALDPLCYDAGELLGLDSLSHDDAWTRVDPWLPTPGENAYPGYADVPVLEATRPGASLSFTQKARAVGLLVLAGPDAGKVEVRIDGGDWVEHDLFVEASQTRHLPRWVLFASDLDPDAEHTVELRVAEERNPRSRGNRCRLMAPIVNR